MPIDHFDEAKLYASMAADRTRNTPSDWQEWLAYAQVRVTLALVQVVRAQTDRQAR